MSGATICVCVTTKLTSPQQRCIMAHQLLFKTKRAKLDSAILRENKTLRFLTAVQPAAILTKPLPVVLLQIFLRSYAQEALCPTNDASHRARSFRFQSAFARSWANRAQSPQVLPLRKAPLPNFQAAIRRPPAQRQQNLLGCSTWTAARR